MKKELTGYPSVDRLHESGYNFFERNITIPNMSVYNVLKLMTLSLKKEIAVDCKNLNATFDQLLKDTLVLSKSFKELGIKEKDIVTVITPNYYQSIVAYLAANRIGAVTTFLNSFSSDDEIKKYLNLYESPLLINFDKNEEENKSLIKDTKLKNIITIRNSDLMQNGFSNYIDKQFGYNNFLNYSDMRLLSKYYKSLFKTNFGSSYDSLIVYTSGTTGKPKSVVLTNENILASGMFLKSSSRVSDTKGEKSLVCVPFCYPYGIATSTIMSLLCGREAVLAPDISSDTISYYLSKNPNIIFGSPALLELIKRNTPENQDLSSVHTFISGGDFLVESQSILGEKFFEEHNAKVEISNGSGNAETVGAGTNAFGIKVKRDTVGKPLVGTSVIIYDETNQKELQYGEEGELCVSGKNVFKEYYNEPELTKDAMLEYKGKKYFKTGTLGYLDNEGYFHLTNRKSRFYIISSLNKVYCDRVQNIISSVDMVDKCAVIPKSHESKLYIGKAYVVLKNGEQPTKEMIETIKKIISGTLKPYEVPEEYEFISQIPLTQADKVDYSLLSDYAEGKVLSLNQN